MSQIEGVCGETKVAEGNQKRIIHDVDAIKEAIREADNLLFYLNRYSSQSLDDTMFSEVALLAANKPRDEYVLWSAENAIINVMTKLAMDAGVEYSSAGKGRYRIPQDRDESILYYSQDEAAIAALHLSIELMRKEKEARDKSNVKV